MMAACQCILRQAVRYVCKGSFECGILLKERDLSLMILNRGTDSSSLRHESSALSPAKSPLEVRTLDHWVCVKTTKHDSTMDKL
jgi:hypothetical protein